MCPMLRYSLDSLLLKGGTNTPTFVSCIIIDLVFSILLKRRFARKTATKIVLDNDPDLYRDRLLQECLANCPFRGQAIP